MSSETSLQAPGQARITAGFWLGMLGVAVFAMTLPATRLATGSAADPQLSPLFLTLGRAALAGLASALYLLITRAPWPTAEQSRSLLLAVAGNVIGYPLLLAWALREVTASHAAVITALLPLATAAIAAWSLGQRARPAFWVCASLGALAALGYALLREWQLSGSVGLSSADAWLAAAVVAASVGYVYGARVTPQLGAERVICWVCVFALPLTLPSAWWLWPQQPVRASSWAAFVYVGLFSMWIGFFAWYRGLAWGGALRVSQTQLLQPFLSMLFAWPLLGEPLDAQALGFALAVVATVFLSRKLA